MKTPCLPDFALALVLSALPFSVVAAHVLPRTPALMIGGSPWLMFDLQHEKGEIAIPTIDIAIDSGAQVNPERVRAQAEGACVMGAGNSLLSEISFKAGRVEQSNFHDYQVARMNVAPRDIRVHLIGSDFDAPLGGVGEQGVPPIAPVLSGSEMMRIVLATMAAGAPKALAAEAGR